MSIINVQNFASFPMRHNKNVKVAIADDYKLVVTAVNDQDTTPGVYFSIDTIVGYTYDIYISGLKTTDSGSPFIFVGSIADNTNIVNRDFSFSTELDNIGGSFTATSTLTDIGVLIGSAVKDSSFTLTAISLDPHERSVVRWVMMTTDKQVYRTQGYRGESFNLPNDAVDGSRIEIYVNSSYPPEDFYLTHGNGESYIYDMYCNIVTPDGVSSQNQIAGIHVSDSRSQCGDSYVFIRKDDRWLGTVVLNTATFSTYS